MGEIKVNQDIKKVFKTESSINMGDRDRDEGVKLFVYGVSSSCPKDLLESEFGQCGRVNDIFHGKGSDRRRDDRRDGGRDRRDGGYGGRGRSFGRGSRGGFGDRRFIHCLWMTYSLTYI